MTTLSLAAMARMSAQETTPGHTFSTADLTASMTSNPLTEPLLGLAIFSPWKLGVSSSSSDASQPYIYIHTLHARGSQSQIKQHNNMRAYLHGRSIHTTIHVITYVPGRSSRGRRGGRWRRPCAARWRRRTAPPT
jgi:hypothetical protein